MPNWCNNSVTISHTDSSKIEALAAAVREGKFCNHVIPVPEDLNIVAGSVGDPVEQAELERKTAENFEKYGAGNWYDFCTSRWGTKWDVDAYEGENVKVGQSAPACIARRAADDIAQFVQFDEVVALAAQLVGDHRRPGRAADFR